MHFEVETNTARATSMPCWRPLLERDGTVAVWDGASKAHDETAAEGRDGFRVVQVDVDGDTRTVVPMQAQPGFGLG